MRIISALLIEEAGDDYVSMTDLELSPNRWSWLLVDTSQLEKGWG